MLINRQTTTAVRTMVTAITMIMVMSMIMLADARAGRRSNQPVGRQRSCRGLMRGEACGASLH
jgi:hypothetical protein